MDKTETIDVDNHEDLELLKYCIQRQKIEENN